MIVNKTQLDKAQAKLVAVKRFVVKLEHLYAHPEKDAMPIMTKLALAGGRDMISKLEREIAAYHDSKN